MFKINGCIGSGKEQKYILKITPEFGIVLSDQPSAEIRKNQKEILGFEYEEIKHGENCMCGDKCYLTDPDSILGYIKE